MKKYFYFAIMLVTIALSLTSCGKDEPKEKTTATTIYTMTFSQDLLEAANVIVYYKAENGRTTFKPLSDPSKDTYWTQTVTSDKFPAEFGVMCDFGTKTDNELIKDKYDLTCTLKYTCTTNKGAAYANNYVIIDEKQVAKKNVNSKLTKIKSNSYGFKITENGVPTVMDNKLKFD